MLRLEHTVWALVVILPLMLGLGCPGGGEPFSGVDSTSDDTTAREDLLPRTDTEALPETDAIAPDVIDFDVWQDPDVFRHPNDNDWELVAIVDSPDNTLNTCNAGNPGADIDAVELYRDGALHGWAHSVEAIDNDMWGADWACDNDENLKDDPDEMLGLADGVANSEDGFEGYFSLNGCTVYLLMSEIMYNGDELVVYEMFNAENPEATIEDYQVYLGFYTDDGDMAFVDDPFFHWNTGLVTGYIDGLW